MGELDGKLALVTGAARGLGACITEVMLREGATVIAADIRKDEGKALIEKLGTDRLTFVELDVTDEESWSNAVTQLRDQHGRIDVLVNNAGILTFNPVTATSSAEFRRIMDVNSTGVFLGIKAVLPVMIEAGSGVIVNISSVDGFREMPTTAPYAASKHAVLGLTKSTALEVAQAGVRVVAVCPGVMATGMAEDANAGELGDVSVDALVTCVPMNRIADPHEVAEVASFLASDRASFCTGMEVAVDGGWSAGLPIPLG